LSSGNIKLTVIRDNVLRFQATIRDFNDALMNPDSHAIKLLKPDGTQQSTDYTSPTKDTDGIYHQDVDIPADAASGEWSLQWTTVKDSHNTTERIRFKVIT